MTAPALILLAQGSDDPSVIQSVHALRKNMQELRPELSIYLAFLDHCPPSGPQVVSTLVNRGVDEIVFVPLDIARAIDAAPEAEIVAQRVRVAHPDLRVTIARPVGPAVELLNLLDVRLRNALASNHVLELDALVLSVPHAGDIRGNALVSRRARQWSSHHRLPVVVAYADGSGPSVTTAIANLRGQGRRAIAVGSFFLSADAAFVSQTEQALAAGAVAVSAPFCADERIGDLVMARYAYGAMALLDYVTDGVAVSEAEPTPVEEASQTVALFG